MQTLCHDAFYCRDFRAGNGADGNHARADRLSILVRGAGSAKHCPATEFCSCQAQDFAQVPKHRHLGITGK